MIEERNVKKTHFMGKFDKETHDYYEGDVKIKKIDVMAIILSFQDKSVELPKN